MSEGAPTSRMRVLRSDYIIATPKNRETWHLGSAIQGFDDQPSWVPDWSAHGNNNWAYDVAAIDKSDDFGDRSNLRAFSIRPQVSFVFKERDTVLSIRARHVCQVYNCFRFQQANARDPDESVDAIHLDNLRIILELASSRPVFPAGSSRAFVNEAFGFETMTSIATFTNSNLFPFFILKALDLDLEEMMSQLNKAQFTRWRSFCTSNCRKTPVEAMTLLQNAPDIREIQISMCNLLSSENKTLFYAATAGNKPWTRIFGCGSHGVENGDSIVRFQGVPHRLIVRKIFPSTARGGHAVKLVSPCRMYTTLKGIAKKTNEENHEPCRDEGRRSHAGGLGAAPLQGLPTHVSFEAERTHRKNHLAAAFRHWCREGYVFGFSDHISYRDPEFREASWTNPLSVQFGLLRASDMLLVDLDRRIVGGNRSRLANTAGFLIYAAVHMARGDVHAVCHCHSPAGKAWSAVGRRLDMLTKDACKFLGDAHAVRRVRRRRPRG
ncbi:class II aldolase/adducin N-terminal [Apiospora arundinis]